MPTECCSTRVFHQKTESTEDDSEGRGLESGPTSSTATPAEKHVKRGENEAKKRSKGVKREKGGGNELHSSHEEVDSIEGEYRLMPR